jgi:hypothetical protein
LNKRSSILLAGACVVLSAAALWLSSRGSPGRAAAGSDDEIEPASSRPSLSIPAEKRAEPARPFVESLSSAPAQPAADQDRGGQDRGGQDRGGGERPERGPPGVLLAADPAVIERVSASRSRTELALTSSLARAGVRPPAAIDELFQRLHAGASPDQLRAFVRSDFPNDLRLRVLTLRWINRLAPARRRLESPLLRLTGKPAPPLGSIQRLSPPRPPPARR